MTNAGDDLPCQDGVTFINVQVEVAGTAVIFDTRNADARIHVVTQFCFDIAAIMCGRATNMGGDNNDR